MRERSPVRHIAGGPRCTPDLDHTCPVWVRRRSDRCKTWSSLLGGGSWDEWCFVRFYPLSDSLSGTGIRPLVFLMWNKRQGLTYCLLNRAKWITVGIASTANTIGHIWPDTGAGFCVEVKTGYACHLKFPSVDAVVEHIADRWVWMGEETILSRTSSNRFWFLWK